MFKNITTFLAVLAFAAFAQAGGIVGSGSLSGAGLVGGSATSGGGLSGTAGTVTTESGGYATAHLGRRNIGVEQGSGTTTSGGSLSGSLGNAAAGTVFGGAGVAASGGVVVRRGWGGR